MGVYRDLRSSQGVYRVLIAQLVARFPWGMTSLIILLHVEQLFHRYTEAGIALAASSISAAVAGPVLSRMMGKYGMRPVLAVSTLVTACALLAIAYAPANIIWIVAAAIVSGFAPPVAPAARTIYPKMVPGKQLSALYALDAAAQEIIWVIGPVVAVFTAVQFGPPWGLTIAVLILILGTTWFLSNPEVSRVAIPTARRRFGAVLTRKTVLFATLIGFAFITAYAALEAGIVAIYGHEGLEGGVLLGMSAAASLLGGVFMGHRALHKWSLPSRLGIVTVGIVMCIFSTNFWWLAAWLMVAGFGMAPALASIASLISSTVKFSETAEAFGWSNTGQLIGAALGSALAGVFIDSLGPTGAFVVAAVAGALTVFISLLAIPVVPDLRGRDASPIADTEQFTAITPPEAIG
ncbi:MFS transporter [Canibacter zhoujuaniae]|uniref:MFS transporter n=1 Tax=Canibacter zhoujuaniae TaxID=2708343 RepID=UPI001420812C|nr:MFS transporter [Canibacter zhoujuaniae]